MKPAVYKIMTIDVSAGEKYQFRVSGSQIIFPGFIKLTGTSKEDVILPELEEGEELVVEDFNPEQHFTQPPPRFTEARLVKTLEEEGIGRPSTYAPTISTIISRGYVERVKNKLKPTKLGFIVIDLLTEYFPNVTDTEFTAQMEERLDKIEEDEEYWREVLSDFYHPFKEKLEVAREEMEEVNFVEETDEVCDKCGKPMVVKHGRYGKFLACSGYPECKNTKPFLIKTGVKCPKCEDGELVERKSKKGRKFYGCSNYPDCEFLVWDKPVEEKCPECGGLMVEKHTRKRGDYHKCINKECGHIVEI
ncbi:MAG: DNA topoisomerase, partial [Halanaerobium sp.]